MKKHIEKFAFPGICLLVTMLFLYIIIGLSAALSALAIAVFFFIPVYFILDNFELDTDEKLVFSFFIGVGVIPSLAFYMALYISFKVSVLISFGILLLAGFLIKRHKGKKNA